MMSGSVVMQLLQSNSRQMMSMNEYIDAAIVRLLKSKRWNTQIVNTSHDTFVADFYDTLFTKFVNVMFTSTYVRKHFCPECGGTATERCHGVDRRTLIHNALKRVYIDTSRPVVLKDILIAFLEEHKNSGFCFKCHNCHVAETRATMLCRQ
jgi:hypothetical protein